MDMQQNLPLKAFQVQVKYVQIMESVHFVEPGACPMQSLPARHIGAARRQTEDRVSTRVELGDREVNLGQEVRGID